MDRSGELAGSDRPLPMDEGAAEGTPLSSPVQEDANDVKTVRPGKTDSVLEVTYSNLKNKDSFSYSVRNVKILRRYSILWRGLKLATQLTLELP
jgi:hypothetical protein